MKVYCNTPNGQKTHIDQITPIFPFWCCQHWMGHREHPNLKLDLDDGDDDDDESLE